MSVIFYNAHLLRMARKLEPSSADCGHKAWPELQSIAGLGMLCINNNQRQQTITGYSQLRISYDRCSSVFKTHVCVNLFYIRKYVYSCGNDKYLLKLLVLVEKCYLSL